MICKDCVHYEVCVNLITEPKRIESMSYGNSETWLCFKDKSKFIELPRAEKALEGINHD